MPFAAIWMDLEMILLTEVSQTEKDRYHKTLLTRGIQKKIQINISTKQNTQEYRKQTYWKGKYKLGAWD